MSTLKITRGLPASGKSTFAREWVAEDPDNRMQVSRDDLRWAFYKAFGKLSRAQENMVTVAETGAVEAALERDKDVVVDAMHLRPRYIRRWERFARERGAEFEIEEFLISIEESISRNLAREVRGEHFVAPEALWDIRKFLSPDGSFLPYEPWVPEPGVEVERYVADPSKPDAIIVDIDGTMALNTSGRSWYDLSRVHEDSLCEPVDMVVEALAAWMHVDVIFLSGREATAEGETRGWLDETAGWAQGAYELYMRRASDERPDTIVKRELFDAHVRNRYNVLAVIDDRPSVCRMWRELGLFTLQVGDPHVEF